MKIVPLFVKEVAEYRSENRKLFEKQFSSYKRELRTRLKTFERHGDTSSEAYKRLKETLYDAVHSKRVREKEYAFSRMSMVMSSNRGSYTRSLEADRNVVSKLNAEWGKGFITVRQLREWGLMMNSLKDSALAEMYSSDELVPIVRHAQIEARKTGKSWRELVEEQLGVKGILTKEDAKQ